MIKAIKLFSLLAASVFLLSFTSKSTEAYVGTYGVSSSDPSQIKLMINPDHTFYYQDFSVANKKIIAGGTWELNGNKVVLTSNVPVKKFHDTWTFEENGQIAKSRKGFCFYRLGKISD